MSQWMEAVKYAIWLALFSWSNCGQHAECIFLFWLSGTRLLPEAWAWESILILLLAVIKAISFGSVWCNSPFTPQNSKRWMTFCKLVFAYLHEIAPTFPSIFFSYYGTLCPCFTTKKKITGSKLAAKKFHQTASLGLRSFHGIWLCNWPLKGTGYKVDF